MKVISHAINKSTRRKYDLMLLLDHIIRYYRSRFVFLAELQELYFLLGLMGLVKSTIWIQVFIRMTFVSFSCG